MSHNRNLSQLQIHYNTVTHIAVTKYTTSYTTSRKELSPPF